MYTQLEISSKFPVHTLHNPQYCALGVFSLPTVQPKILTSGLLQWMELAFISEPRIHRQQAAARLTPFPPHIHLNPSQTDVTVFVGPLLPELSFSDHARSQWHCLQLMLTAYSGLTVH